MEWRASFRIYSVDVGALSQEDAGGVQVSCVGRKVQRRPAQYLQRIHVYLANVDDHSGLVMIRNDRPVHGAVLEVAKLVSLAASAHAR